MRRKPVELLVAEDDPGDRLLLTRAWKKAGARGTLRFVSDGGDLLAYLRRQDGALRPALVLLDLNMPVVDGHAALAEMKSDPALADIPVVVLTSSTANDDIERCYREGAATYVVKPADFQKLVSLAAILGEYWLEVAELPG